MTYELFLDIVRAKRKLLICLILLALADLALYLFVALWQGPELERAQSAYFTARAAAGSGGATQRTVNFRNGVHDLSLFEERLINKRDFARFLGELFDTAAKDRLVLKSIGYQPSVLKEQGLVSYAMTLAVAGKYPAAKSFIADLSRNPSMVTVDSVTMRNASAIEEAVELQLHITVYLKTEGA